MLLSSALAGGQAPKGKSNSVREIHLVRYQGPRDQGDATKPTAITNAAELAKAIPDKEWQDCIASQVDFSREYLLFFAWAGSGQDKLSFEVGGRGIVPAVEFHYRRGLTQDLRSHFHLFAVAKNLTWNVRQDESVRFRQESQFSRRVESDSTEITTEKVPSNVIGEAFPDR
jgi:hypothetical protein